MNDYKRLALYSAGAYVLATLLFFGLMWLDIEIQKAQPGGEDLYLADLALVVPSLSAIAGLPVFLASAATLLVRKEQGLRLGVGISALCHAPALYLSGFLFFGIISSPPWFASELLSVLGAFLAMAIHLALMFIVGRYLYRHRLGAPSPSA